MTRTMMLETAIDLSATPLEKITDFAQV